jgi:hypothetical protein
MRRSVALVLTWAAVACLAAPTAPAPARPARSLEQDNELLLQREDSFRIGHACDHWESGPVEVTRKGKKCVVTVALFVGWDRELPHVPGNEELHKRGKVKGRLCIGIVDGKLMECTSSDYRLEERGNVRYFVIPERGTKAEIAFRYEVKDGTLVLRGGRAFKHLDVEALSIARRYTRKP